MRAASLAVIACATAFASYAHADDASPREQSRSSFRRGVTLAEHGDYAAARDAFVEAYRLYPHPSILLNLGIARWRSGEFVDAEQDLAKFLADDGGASSDEVASARAAIVAVRDHLGTLRVRARPDSARATVDGKAVALVPGGVDVRALVGRHALVVEADGYARATQDVDVVRARITAIDVTLARVGEGPGGEHTEPGASRQEPGGADATRATIGWFLVGTAVVSAGVGTYCGVRALSLASAYNDPTDPSYQNQSTKSTGITLRTLSDVSFGGALVLGGVGAWLLFKRPPPDTQQALVISPAFTGFRGTF